MGDAYKGLTIRIGADMTELNRALRSSNSAIHETQKQLRTLQKAAKLDPADMRIAAQQMEVMGDKAQALTAKLRTMKSSDFMRNLKEDTEDAALKAKLATAEYSKMCDEIKQFKNALAMAAGYDLKEKDPFKDIEIGSKAAKEMIVKLAKEIDKTSDGTKELAEYGKLLGRYWKALSNNNAADLTAQTRKFKTELSAAEAETRALYAQVTRLSTANPAATLTKDFERFKREMQSADSIATELRGELSKLDNALKMDPGNIEAARLKMANMQDQVRLNVTQLKELNTQISSLKAGAGNVFDKLAKDGKDFWQELLRAENEVTELAMSLDKAKARLMEMDADTSISKQSKLYEFATQQVEKYSIELREAKAWQDQLASAKLYTNLTSQHAALSAATTKLTNDMQDAGNKSALMRGSMQQLGWAMYSTLTPAMMMFGYSAVNSAETVDAAYRNMRKTVQGTEEQFEALKQGAIDFSRTHVTSADQILEIQAMGGQLGIATENLAAFAETVSNIEIATNLDAETAAQQLGQLQGMLNDMTEDDFDNFGDALVRLGNNNATLEDKIMNVMLRIASMGTITGFTTTELLAWSTAVAATGQGAEAAGTAISKTFSDIEAAVGAGGAELKAFADIAQMSADDFANAWNDTPSKAMYAFVNGLKAIEANGGSADAALEGLGITSVRQKQSILGLMQTIDGLNDNLEMSKNAWNGVDDNFGKAGDAAREAQRKAEGFSGTIKILRNNIQDFGVEMGESFAWAISLLGDFVANATQAYSDLPNLTKQIINFGVLGAAALGPMLVATNAVVGAGGDLVRGVKSMGTAWSKTVKNAKDYTKKLSETVPAVAMLANANDKATSSFSKLTKAQKLAAASGAAFAATLAVSTIILIADHYQKTAERAENLRLATDGLNNSMHVTNQSFIDAARSINGVNYRKAIGSFGEIRDAIYEATEAQAQMATEFTHAWAEINGSEYALESYLAVITELTDGTALTAEEQGKLAAAVAGYNEIMGTSVTVTDAQNGYLSVSTEELKKNAQAWIDNAKAQAAQEQMVELQKQQFTNTQNLAAATEQLSIAQGEYDLAVKNNVEDLTAYEKRLADAEKAHAEATATCEAAEQQIDDLSRAYQLATGALTTLTTGLNLTEDEFVEFAKVLGYEGEEAVENFAAAILAGEEETAWAAAAIQAAASGMANGNTWEWGYHLVQSFANGMKAAKSLTTSVASQIASGIAAYIHFTHPDIGPLKSGTEIFGRHLVQDFAKGMEMESSLASDAADALAASVANALSSDGLTVQAKVAGEIASLYGSARAQQVVNTTNSSAVSNYYITANIDVHDLEGISTVEEFVQLLERSN